MKKIIIIGAGILGLSIARELSIRGHRRITILEKESNIATHQSSRNSGVMHSGLYYKPGSLKARLCRKGINLMKDYCTKQEIPWNECGKIVVATKPSQSTELEKLLFRGRKNNLIGLKRINTKEINQIEPYVNAFEGILVPEESVVSYAQVAENFLKECESFGVRIIYNSQITKYVHEKKEIHLKKNEKIDADLIISASGLYNDKVSKMLGLNINNQQIIPFRGEYYNLKEEFSFLVNNLIYPVPNTNLPFLGVHFTKMINGNIEAGPNAVLALAREGYDWKKINLVELKESLFYPGLRNFIKKYPMITLGEISRSLSKKLFVKSLKALIPEINEKMLDIRKAGVRAQLMDMNGRLIQDFDIRINKNLVSILNAPSPAATSSLAIAKYIANYLDL